MKKIFLSICALAILAMLSNSCKKDDIPSGKKEGQVEFGFSLKVPSHSGAQKSSAYAVAEPAAVVVSVKKANGVMAYSTEKVDLYSMNGYYISKPLSLLPGSYTVEQFLVVDAAGSVMYASPVQGSPKAYLVSKPLPIGFTVGKDNVTKVTPEVLSAAGSTPEDFGYTTFSFDVVNTFDFLIGVFAYNESAQNFELTTANLTIVAASKTIFADTLAAITNQVTLNDGYDSYLLTVTKNGYKTWTDTLTAAELKLYFRSEDKGPLEVMLEKGANSSESIWFITDQQITLKKVELNFFGDIPEILINWGDGTPTEMMDASHQMIHNYSTPGIYKAVISGQIQSVTGFWAHGQITSLDISNATNLTNLVSAMNLLDTIDISKNINLELLSLDYNKINAIDLSKNINIKSLTIGNNNLYAIDLSKNLKLEWLWVANNPLLENIDVSMLKELRDFFAHNCKLTTLDVTANSKLETLDLLEIPGLKQMNLSNNHMIKDLSLSGLDFKTLDFSNFPNLEKLSIWGAGISIVDISQNPNLTHLWIGGGSPITALDISNNKNLISIYLIDLSFSQANINKVYLDLYANVTQTGLKYGSVSHNGFLIPNGEALVARMKLIKDYYWTMY